MALIPSAPLRYPPAREDQGGKPAKVPLKPGIETLIGFNKPSACPPHRAIRINAMTTAGELPHIDEHSTPIEAGANATWEALLRVVDGSFAANSRGARLLGCADIDTSGPRPLAPGSTMPGFHVQVAERPRELALAGRHRFSSYALIFRLEQQGEGSATLRAETRAAFPGLKGRAYRALVIGTRIHVLVTRRLLGAVKQRAERH
jgi:hypothetical protein